MRVHAEGSLLSIWKLGGSREPFARVRPLGSFEKKAFKASGLWAALEAFRRTAGHKDELTKRFGLIDGDGVQCFRKAARIEVSEVAEEEPHVGLVRQERIGYVSMLDLQSSRKAGQLFG